MRPLVELEFVGELWYWRGPAPYHFIRVPEDACVGLRAVSPIVSYGWGMIPVRVRVGGSAWETSLFPKDGRYVVPIKDVVRNAEGLSAPHVRDCYRAARALPAWPVRTRQRPSHTRSTP